METSLRGKLAFSAVCLSHLPQLPDRTVHWSPVDVQFYDASHGVELRMTAARLPTGLLRVTDLDARDGDSLIFDARRFYCSVSLRHGDMLQNSERGFKGCVVPDNCKFAIEYQKGMVELWDQTVGRYFWYRVGFDRRFPILPPQSMPNKVVRR